MMKIEIDRIGVQADTRILHIAPERGLFSYLNAKSQNYVCADIDVERYSHIPDVRYIDLCDPKTYNSWGNFDLIIHSHVIEHIPCNYTVALIHLHNMLSQNGVHLFCVPIYSSHYEEHLGKLSEEEKTQRFGQFDHCRKFSPKDLHCTLGALFKIDAECSLIDRYGLETIKSIGVPENDWDGYNGGSVFTLRRSDLLI